MVVDLLGIVSSLPVHVLSFGLLGEFDPLGVDGFVLFATLLVLFLVVATRRSEPRGDKSTRRDEQVIDRALPASRVPVATSPSTPSTSAIAPALSATPLSSVLENPESLPSVSTPSVVQPAKSDPERPKREVSGLLELPDRVATRVRLRSAR